MDFLCIIRLICNRSMSLKKVNIRPNLIKAAIVTILGLLISITSLHRLLNLLDFTNSSEGADFQMSDVYNRVADNRSVRTLSKEILIVPLDGYGRFEIADIITTVNSLKPKAMGLDIMFLEEYEGDITLIKAIEACPNIVLPLAHDEGADKWIGSYFYSAINNEHHGVINLDANAINQSVRTYRPVYTHNGLQANSFATEIVSITSPDIYQQIVNAKVSARVISYPSTEFQIIDVEDLLLSPEKYLDMIAGRIVLLGDINNPSDYHVTPVKAGMPGIFIHAHTLDTILSGKDIKMSSKWLNWLFAFVICYLFMCVKLFVSDKSQDFGQLVIRILQVVSLYLLFITGCNIFINKLTYVDFSPVLLMLTISLFVCDLWEGCVYLFNVIFRKEKV